MPSRAAMGLDALPTALLDFVVEVAGYEHGWRLEVASPALREASAVCVSRRLGTCWWTEERPERLGCRTAVFQPRWRHCAAAKRCGPFYLQAAGKPSDIESCLGPGVDVELRERGDDEPYVVFQGSNDFASSVAFVTRRDAERFVIERVPDSTTGSIFRARIISLRQRHELPSFVCIDIREGKEYGMGFLVLVAGERTNTREFQYQDTEWLLGTDDRFKNIPPERASHLGFCEALHPVNDMEELYFGAMSHQRESHQDVLCPFTVPHWELVSAALPEAEMYFEFEHAQL